MNQIHALMFFMFLYAFKEKKIKKYINKIKHYNLWHSRFSDKNWPFFFFIFLNSQRDAIIFILRRDTLIYLKIIEMTYFPRKFDQINLDPPNINIIMHIN